MVVNYITNFTEYLNNNGFSISSDRIPRFFELFNSSGADFSSTEDVITIMKLVFCNNHAESITLPTFFKKFQEHYEEQARLKQRQNELSSLLAGSQQKIDAEERKYQEKLQNLKENQKSSLPNPLTKKDKKFLELNKKKIDKLELTEKQKGILGETGNFFENKSGASEKDLEKLKKKLADESYKALNNNDLTKFNFLKTLFDIAAKLEKVIKKKNKGIKGAIEDLEKTRRNNLAKIQIESAKAKSEREKIQKQLDEQLSKDVTKVRAEEHRSQFAYAKNSVRTTENTPDCVNKNFKQLSAKEKADIYSYIKYNLSKFKTRMNRNINTLTKQSIDIQRTIQSACKTGGLPIQLAFNKPVRSKSNLILVLDVSGSCKEASEMMLTFMYLLKDLFTNGCKTYVFIDSLYDVSEIMESENLEHSIEKVLSSIPRNYSNYFKPLRNLWEEHKREITKDSLVIFIGDARNNNNPHGTEYLKDISRRAKSCYWLNTEKMNEWGCADSLAYEYAEFAKMYEVLNVKDIISVINEMK